MRTLSIAAALNFLPSAPLLAQPVTGDIGAVAFSSNAFAVLPNPSYVPVGYTTTGFQGSGTSQSILWDPANPDSFYIGGFGFVGRATIGAGGAVSYSLITNNVSTAAQMSFDASGNIVVADAGADQVSVLDVSTGTVTSLTTGAQPWGSTVNAGFYNPADGKIYVGNQGSTSMRT